MKKDTLISTKNEAVSKILKQINPGYLGDLKAFLEFSNGETAFSKAEEFLCVLREGGCKPSTYNHRLYALKSFYKAFLKADSTITAFQKAEIIEKINSLKQIKIVDDSVEDDQFLEDWEI